MNAVRMSHYPPDTHFLDLCDELGLYVLDELAGWQKRYDEAAGAPLVEAMVTRDVNHPSIIFWDNGNEGGWNTALDDDFALYDPQRRTVLHPWATFSGINTDHYETYESTRTHPRPDRTIFMPTEFLHGLYDGGAGAGLDDYWKLMGTAPRSAGGFIWAFWSTRASSATTAAAPSTSTATTPPTASSARTGRRKAASSPIKDIWSPIQLADRDYYAHRSRRASTAPSASSTGTTSPTSGVPRSPGSSSTSSAGDGRTGHHGIAQGRSPSPDIAPGASGALRLACPPTGGADALG